ncbi:threonine/serine exporter family protein [Rothia aerolata]|uniref:Threonine/serine exporter family protein n=1 Tax=Rothia aerolata TaxID=1812262 RepID=A0A917IS43_9MICC|nr:threonine/serine exporter family protein [Rothia aerolata]GGH61633.1 hypothetical protein GCM10007359_11000 [Rothia aerolata]
MMTEPVKNLQQKSYPSAFDSAPVEPETASADVFGASSSLPQAGAAGEKSQDERSLGSSAFERGSVGEESSAEPDSFESSPFEPNPDTGQAPALTTALPVISVVVPEKDRLQGVQPATYPSADHTTAIPKISRGERRRNHRWVPTSLKSFVHADQSLTKPMRGMARLAQKQFAVASQQRRDREEYVREKEQAREILNFSLRLSETMFHYGADTVDVDSAIVSVCAAYGLDDIEIDITNQSVIINYVSDIDQINVKTQMMRTVSDSDAPGRQEKKEERFSHTVMRVVRSWSENYAALDDIYKLIYDITTRGLSMPRAERRLLQINEAKKPYSPLLIMLANIMTAFGLTMGLGGSLAAGIAAGLVFLAIHFVNQLIARLNLPSFFNMAAGAGVVTFTAIYISDPESIFASIGVNVAAAHIVAAGLIMMLPTSRLVSSVQDALNGFPLTAAGKVVSTGMSFLGIVVGLASAVMVLGMIGTAELNIEETVFDPANVWVHWIFMMIACVATGMTFQARWKTLLWVALISSCGIWTYNLILLVLGADSSRAATAGAALVIGLASTYLAYRLHAPAAIFFVPGLTFLLPGLSIFRGLYMFTVETNFNSTGVPGMVTAVGIVVSMASGVVLGSYIMQNIIQRVLRPRRNSASGFTETQSIQVLDR